MRTLWALSIIVAPGLGASALAADHVVYVGETRNVAIARVVVATGVDPDSLQATDFNEYASNHRPGLAGPGDLASCEGDPSTSAVVRALLGEAEGSVSFMEYEGADATFVRAERALGCLEEILDPEVAGRLYYLMAMSHLGRDDRPSGWEDFGQAWLFHPDIRWDDNFAPDGKPTFVAAGAEARATDAIPVFLLPSPEREEIFINGVEVRSGRASVDLRPGKHIVQWQGDAVQTAILTVVSGPSPALLSPKPLPVDLLYWATERRGHAALSAAMGGIGGMGDTVYLTAYGGVWRTRLGQGEWEELAEATSEPSDEPVVEEVAAAAEETGEESAGSEEVATVDAVTRAPLSTRKLLQSGLRYGGGTIAIAGIALAARSYTSALEHYDQLVDASDNLAYDRAAEDYLVDAKSYQTMAILAGVGAAMTTAGFFLQDQRQVWIQPLVMEDGGLGAQIGFTPKP